MAKIILTGDRPTGRLHVGHYVGSLRRRVELQNSGEVDKIFIMIADAQALTDNFDNPEKVRQNIIEVALDYLSAGLDAAKSTLCVQSQISGLTELTFFYANLVTVSRLQRNPTVKSEIKMRNFETSIPVGFFTYPISLAADITAFKATVVPAGEDQLPMIEQTREIVRKFNSIYDEVLVEPDVLLIAIERVQDALVLAMEAAIRKGLKNVFFVSLDAANIDQFFADDEIDLLYINFCDPWPRKKNAKRRLTYHTFLEKYKKVLKLGGQIHFKTDNANLFAWSLPEMESCFLQLRNVTDDLHTNGPVGIMTGYEEKFYALGTPIHRVEAVVTPKQPRPADEKPEPADTED